MEGQIWRGGANFFGGNAIKDMSCVIKSLDPKNEAVK
jgi:hypothetical protein